MTVEFAMHEVDVGPRVVVSTYAGVSALEALRFETHGKGVSGASLDAATMLKRCDRFMKSVPSCEKSPGIVFECVLALRSLAWQTLKAGRRHVVWRP